MLRARILGRPDGKDELFDEMRWSKKQENQNART